ncbi:hypothetical protein VTK56DRAFT_5238 [Thermocarpiscus australiensis]
MEAENGYDFLFLLARFFAVCVLNGSISWDRSWSILYKSDIGLSFSPAMETEGRRENHFLSVTEPRISFSPSSLPPLPLTRPKKDSTR